MKRGPFQILVALDELANAFAWGSARQTISARSWAAKVKGRRWGRIAVRLIDAMPWFGPGHCQAAWLSEQPPA